MPQGLEALAARYHFPSVRPDVPAKNHGWFGKSNATVLKYFLLDSPTQCPLVVVELGVWTGKSARYIAGLHSDITVIAVDHWLGSAEHHLQPSFKSELATLYETFLASCWKQRKQIIPLRLDTLNALLVIRAYGIAPYLIYVDAGHDYDSVAADIHAIRKLFPSAIIVGDDWDWDTVRAAVLNVTGGDVRHDGNCWWWVPP